MPLQKDLELSHVIQTTNTTKTAEFEHNGRKIVVEYVKPTVGVVHEARDRAMSIAQRGRTVNYRLSVFDYEVNLLLRCLKDSNIPGVPQGGEVAVRNINDTDLWNKLLTACEIREGEANTDDILAAAQAAIEAIGTEHPAMAALAHAIGADNEEDDAKKS